MLIREFRNLTDDQRLFSAIYHPMAPAIARIAAYFAGINYMPKDEFIRVMNGAGKALLHMGIDCRTDAERIRHQLHQIQTGQQVV